MAPERYDLFIVGGGSAGSSAAKIAARNDLRVGLAEGDKLGGTCLNYGCDPTKTLLRSARLLHDARRAQEFGVRIPQAESDWKGIQKRVRQVVDGMRGGSPEDAVEKQRARGIDIYTDFAAFEEPDTLRVGETCVTAEKILLAVGHEPVVPPIPGLSEADYITNKEAVYLEELPKRLAVIGAGPVGVEFAQIFHRFGCEVVVLEAAPRILRRDDEELALLLHEMLEEEGIRIITGAAIANIDCQEHCQVIAYQEEGEEQRVETDLILAATGRRPALERLQLEQAGVEARADAIEVDEALRTSVPHIWAVGDATGAYPFTHVASAQAQHAMKNILSGESQPFPADILPWATYTHPALSHVGKTEQELKDEGAEYEVLALDLADIPRNVIINEQKGKVKLLAAPDGTLLGGHILGEEADEIIAPVVLAMKAGLKAQDLADAILPYPTLAQAVKFAAGKID
jgi:pyruvate/2-oxoglutarate dehydrogenase complex dihydrolipoamide dehydrogenase (E3) component